MEKITNLRVQGNSYFNDQKILFSTNKIPKSDIKTIFNFSYDMTFGNKGEHRNMRSGGQYQRKNGELFCNTFMGKISEVIIWRILNKKNIYCKKPNLEKWKLGKWDDCDLQVSNKKINIKSAAHFSNLLLLETKDWNEKSEYIPDKTIYDFFVFVRIKPDLKKIFKSKKLFYTNNSNKEIIESIINNHIFYFDIPGFINKKILKFLIVNKYILPQNALLNGKIKMDAENYYIQSKDMIPIQYLFKQLLS